MYGKRLNTREVRTRQNLEQRRHKAVMELQKLNPNYKPPPDYRCCYIVYPVHFVKITFIDRRA